MKKRIAIILAATAALLSNSSSYAADTNSSAGTPANPVVVNDSLTHEKAANSLALLVARVNAKLEMKKMDEAEYADILKDFDSLLAQYKKVDEDRLNILSEKGKVYLTLDDSMKALQVFEDVKAQYPDLVINGSTDAFLSDLKEKAEKQKIRDALAPGTVFPDFNEKDLAGNPLSISKFKGKVVLIDFWATWCPACLEEMPDIVKAYNKYHSKGLEVVGVSLDDDRAPLEKYIKKNKLPWPQLFDGKNMEGKIPVKYGVSYAPTTFLIGRDGKVIKQILLGEDLDAVISAALK